LGKVKHGQTQKTIGELSNTAGIYSAGKFVEMVTHLNAAGALAAASPKRCARD
jgi:hypothetical protein